jgi:hypothetical protein
VDGRSSVSAPATSKPSSTSSASRSPTGAASPTSGCPSWPRPSRTPTSASWAHSPARRSAARYDGWLPQGPATAEGIAYIREQREANGLADRPFAVGHVVIPYVHVGTASFELRQPCHTGSPEQIAEAILAETPEGVSQVQIKFEASSAAEYAEQVEAFGTQVGPLLQR